MKLKICGLKHPDNARQLLTLAPDYLGFIFYKKSPRYVGEPADLDWVKNLPGPTQKVGVFVNEDVEIMKKTAELLDLQVIQLHGEESPEVCSFLKEEGLEVWKAFGVDEDFDFGKTKPYAGVADKFLFDTKGKNRGGNGVAFDWSLLGKYEGETPFVLSGGIGPLPLTPKGEPTDFQVSELRKLWRSDNRASEGSPSGVRGLTVLDINSRFETEPGLKDFNLVKKFKHELFS
ncbi:MAG: phosphoribosylanthranilate isomerase [Lewinellaceae bacterium]|nr:phosphoribosylanthranilate isomerase [Lewinellaceae bacterium]